MGGHNVPEATIRRRYHAGLYNFFTLYRPLADTWIFYDNSGDVPRLVASGEHEQEIVVFDQILWHTIEGKYGRRKI